MGTFRHALKATVALAALGVANGAIARDGTFEPLSTSRGRSAIQTIAPVETAQGGTDIKTVNVGPRQVFRKDLIGPDGLVPDGLYIEANQIIQSGQDDDDADKVVTAKGDVEARYRNRLIRAQEVVYNSTNGLVVARGNAAVINDDKSVQYADVIEMDDQFRAGSASGFASRGADNAKMAAASVVRRSETITELNKAIFTPCELCTKDGVTSQPTWAISADKMIQDKENKVVLYRNAVFTAKGVPVVYLPVLWHPDPSADRASGFLTPKINRSKKRGVTLELPYLWVLSPHQDLVVSPQLNERVNPFLNTTWRKRFYSGEVEIRAGYTNEKMFDFKGRKYGESLHQSYILGRGDFKIDKKWSWGFSAEHASNDSLFDRYNVSDVFETRGLYAADSRRLISQVYAQRRDTNAFASVAFMRFQDLREFDISKVEGTYPPVIKQIPDGIMPKIALAETRWDPKMDILGGRLRVKGSAVSLMRERYVGPPYLPAKGQVISVLQADKDGWPITPEPGVDSARGTLEGDWRSVFVAPFGLRIENFLSVRGDAYHVREYDTSGDSKTITQMLGTAGLELSYPLIRQVGTSSLLITPMAQLAVSPRKKRDPFLPNEDSIVFEFDETTLMRTNRSPGFDLYESGNRLNLGLRADFTYGKGRSLNILIGRSFRDREEDAFKSSVRGTTDVTLYDPSSLAGKASNWLLSVQAVPADWIRGWTRLKIDQKDGTIRRGEAGASFYYKGGYGYARYITDKNTPIVKDGKLVATNGINYESVQAGGEHLFTKNWGVTYNVNRDLKDDVWRRTELGLLYKDDCTRAELVFERDETSIGLKKPNTGVSLRLTLATFGVLGYERFDAR
ncbi:MAG: LPS-assembly protein LptD [Asticcacaulis sp.]